MLIIAAVLTVLSGCGLRRADPDSENKLTVKSDSSLKSGNFYILHDGVYRRVYQKRMTVSPDKASVKNETITMWYTDDYDSIPTLYEGDSLIYYTEEALTDEFVIDRYTDNGWTFGVANLTKSASGRYYFMTSAEENSGATYVCPGTSAAEYFNMQNYKLYIDKIQGVELRSGNVSKGGTVIGLEKDASYDTDVYAGTKFKNCVLKADTFALTYSDSYTVNTCTFLKATTIKIDLPAWFENGYYNINDSGMFRYVKGDSYDAGTNFNTPNKDPNSTDYDPDSYGATAEQAAPVEDTEVVNFHIDNPHKVTVTLKYGPLPSADSVYAGTMPEARILSDKVAYSLRDNGDNTASVTVDLEAGDYMLSIDNLYGREYSYTIE